MPAAIKDAGTAALHSTHDLAAVARIVHEGMVRRGGRAAEHGPTRRVTGALREACARSLRKEAAGAAASAP